MTGYKRHSEYISESHLIEHLLYANLEQVQLYYHPIFKPLLVFCANKHNVLHQQILTPLLLCEKSW